MNLLPVTPQTGGNVLVSKSHLSFPHHYVSSLDFSNLKESVCSEHVCSENVSGERMTSVAPRDSFPHSKTLVDDCRTFYSERLREIKEEDWLEIDPNDEDLLQPENVICCLLGPGDVLLWDSRVVHCSFPGNSKEEKTPGKSEIVPSGAVYSVAHERGNENIESSHGLIRAATLVSMMPRDKASESILQERRAAVDQSRTLTHWANKVAPLGEERESEVTKERECIQWMKRWQEGINTRKVILSFNDLSNGQKRLVRGNQRFNQPDQKQLPVFPRHGTV